MPTYLIDKMSLKQQNINDIMSPNIHFSQFIYNYLFLYLIK